MQILNESHLQDVNWHKVNPYGEFSKTRNSKNKNGNPIKELRDKLNITQKELGDSLGYSRASISKYETGAAFKYRYVTKRAVNRFMDAFSVRFGIQNAKLKWWDWYKKNVDENAKVVDAEYSIFENETVENEACAETHAEISASILRWIAYKNKANLIIEKAEQKIAELRAKRNEIENV